jgi:hypothetical protein
MRTITKRSLVLAIVFLNLLSIPLEQTPQRNREVVVTNFPERHIPAAEVWSEDFEGDLSDWDIYGVNNTADPRYMIPGNFSTEEGVLRAIGPEYNDAAHNSTVAYGTWTFDVDIQDPVDEYHFGIAFMMLAFNKSTVAEFAGINGYDLVFFTPDTGPHEIRLIRGRQVIPIGFDVEELGSHFEDDLIGWHNIIVTRELSGQFYVYLDEGERPIIGGRDAYWTVSEVFAIYTHANPALDNITVSNSIDYDRAPPEWSHPFEVSPIRAGEQFYYDVNATDYSGIDTYWLNDTATFAIDEEGVITNSIVLGVGDYGIRVSVNDTLGNARYSDFTLTVEPADSGIAVELVVISLGVIAVVIVVVVIWRKKG